MTRLVIVLLLLISLACPAAAQSSAQQVASCGAPAAIGDGWTLATPAEVKLGREMLCGIDKLVGQWPEANIHGVTVVKDGKLVLELYYRGEDQRYRPGTLGIVQFAPDVKHDLRSISKSVTSMLVGIALSEGTYPSLDTPVLDAFPDYVDLRTPEKMRITLRHLLTMSSGLAWDETRKPPGDPANSWTQMVRAKDPVRFVLQQAVVSAPGESFTYSSGGTTVLGRALAKATGKRLDDYAREKLFGPLGISDFEWGELFATGEPAAASGLRLRPRDTAKLGQLILADGIWGDQRILPADWVAESTKARINGDNLTHYGYQWWTGETYLPEGTIKWVAGMGLGGQRLFIVPTLDLIVVTNGGLYERGPYSRLEGKITAEVLAQVIRSAMKN
jgi:CubicO group peptidase (beta-lactamase class C family)